MLDQSSFQLCERQPSQPLLEAENHAMPPEPSTSHIYHQYTNALGHLLSRTKLSYEPGQEWARVRELIDDLQAERDRERSVPPYALRPGPFRNLLDRGLIPFLTNIVDDPSVQLTSADLLPACPMSAVSRQRFRLRFQMTEQTYSARASSCYLLHQSLGNRLI